MQEENHAGASQVPGPFHSFATHGGLVWPVLCSILQTYTRLLYLYFKSVNFLSRVIGRGLYLFSPTPDIRQLLLYSSMLWSSSAKVDGPLTSSISSQPRCAVDTASNVLRSVWAEGHVEVFSLKSPSKSRRACTMFYLIDGCSSACWPQGNGLLAVRSTNQQESWQGPSDRLCHPEKHAASHYHNGRAHPGGSVGNPRPAAHYPKADHPMPRQIRKPRGDRPVQTPTLTCKQSNTTLK